MIIFFDEGSDTNFILCFNFLLFLFTKNFGISFTLNLSHKSETYRDFEILKTSSNMHWIF